ncbi:hypothetical protein KVR01_007301 [Diaporthe batatas]|uniref:uncharacterized protein n=1 Tax=Diaporthe batatas TaxID=748121 RepID=UPI001D0445B5|nr:uncharacterized protein KVR01_007301 [Diaporthe batatas]KAG8162823.1 hypothetical protein KVR01_007301 [Diaporthe batatas]
MTPPAQPPKRKRVDSPPAGARRQKAKPARFCAHCGATKDSLEENLDGSDLTTHEQLCQGLDDHGRPLGTPRHCPDPKCEYEGVPNYTTGKLPKPAEMLKSHLNKIHEFRVNNNNTLREARAKLCPGESVTIDMSGNFGIDFTMSTSPKGAGAKKSRKDRTVDEVIKDIFEWFWGHNLYPMSFNAHTSDVNQPNVLAGMLRRLACDETSFMPEETIPLCKLAVLEGSYGSEFGPLAHHSVVEDYRLKATGPIPAEVPRDLKKLTEGFFDELASSGHFGVFVEMMSSRDGKPLEPAIWNRVAQQCSRTGLVLVVDEAMTAVRCGEVFMHKMPQYKQHAPSIVVFGKGFQTAGCALCAGGVSLDGILGGSSDEYLRDAFDPRTFHSRPIQRNQAKDVLNVLHEITFEDLPGRARKIGEAMREILCILAELMGDARARNLRTRDGQGHEPTTSGVGAIIYVTQELACAIGVAPASTGETYMRLLPYLHEVMTDKEKLRELFGPDSAVLRKSLAVKIGTCVVCGLSTTKPQAGEVGLPEQRQGGGKASAEGGLDASFRDDPMYTCTTCWVPICW